MTGLVSLSVNEITVQETDELANVSFSRAGDASGAVTIKYTLAENTALRGSDYIGGGGTVTIPAGERTATIQIPIKNDPYFEPTQDFSVAILSVSSGTLNAPRTTIVNILDDENPTDVDPEPPLVSDYSVTEVPVFEARRPIDIEFVPGQENIMFVATQGGQIRVFDTDTGAFLPNFIDLSAEVGLGSGMQSLEIHPDFPEEPYVYAYYAVDPPETADETGLAGKDGNGNRFQWLVRLEADPATGFRTAIPGSKEILVGAAGQSLDDISGRGALTFGEGPPYKDLPASDQINLSREERAQGLEYRQDYLKGDGDHIGGGMAFGPDGMLYLSTGDGVAFNFADPRTFAVQDPNSLSGKVLRIDPITGRGLADNPFREAGDSLDLNRSKVYQVGLRNPFGLGFSNEGELVIADTGQTSYEEINIGKAGANFGWPFYEGADFDRLFTPPNFRPTPASGFQDEWDAFLATDPEITLPFRGFAHKEAEPGYQFQAIVGGDVDYDGGVYPGSLKGHYFFSDFSDGEVFTIDLDDRKDVKFLYKNETEGPVGFTQGPDGHVYYIDIIGGEVGYLDIEALDGGEPTEDVIGGVVEVIEVTDDRQTVSYGGGVELANAVVFATPVSRNARDPVTVEFKRIGTNEARLYLDEPDHRNGSHAPETFALVALEEGLWEVGDGRRLEVGKIDLGEGDSRARVRFAEAFDATPAVLVQIQSDSGDKDWVIARTKNINERGFTVRLQEEEANDGVHKATVVGFMAIEAGSLASLDTFRWNSLQVQAFRSREIVDDDFTAFDLDPRFNRDRIVAASISSLNDGDTAVLRMNDLRRGDIEFMAQEDRSADREVRHGNESVNGLVFGSTGILTGTDLLI